MPRITFSDSTGKQRSIDVKTGGSLMRAAVDNQVGGITADCGGACACATCHVHIPPELAARIPSAEDMEVSMLEYAENTSDRSRLACQITVTDAFDGAHVVVPARW